MHGQNWLRGAGGSSLDEALDIAYTPSGDSYFVTGYFSGFSNFTTATLSSAGFSDAFLTKYNSDGTPVWAKRFGGTQTDRSNAVIADDNGNAFICGFFSGTASFGTFTLNAVDSSDVFVAKVGPSGDVLWARSAGGARSDGALGIAVDPAGFVIITGSFRGVATFGATTLTSTNFPSSTTPSADIFTARLDPTGNWIWAKKGSAPTDEHPSDVCTDALGNIYICGQYSGDITFDVLHSNVVLNAGYVLKYNSSGVEQWFSKIAATLVAPNAVRCDDANNVWVTGESIGQMVFFGTNTQVVPTIYSQSLFIAQYTAAGFVTWAREDGSDSYVAAKAIAIGPGNEAYITGIFNCDLTEYQGELGEALFNSAGFRDVFVTRYNANGDRAWMRQYSGPREDYCSGIAMGPDADRPRIAGSFEKYFHVPDDGTFDVNTTNFNPGTTSEALENPNPGTDACGFTGYGKFLHLKSIGNKDIFIADPVKLSLPHFDYYTRGDCSYPVVEPCINTTGAPLECPEDISNCGGAGLLFTTHTGSDCWIGPEFDWEWSDGSDDLDLSVSEAGWYWIEIEREDGCASFIDSIHVDIFPLPVPLITDSEEINFESPPDADPIMLCAPASVELTGGGGAAGEGWWTGSDGFFSEENPITVTENGSYTYHIVGANECEGSNNISVNIIDPLEEIDPLLQFSELSTPVNDTLTVCGQEYITVELIDLMEQEDFGIYTDALWQISVDEGSYPPYLGFESYTFAAQVLGWHYITVTPFLFTPEPCPIDTIWYPQQTLQVYINMLDDPAPHPLIEGDNTFCPGDTILVTASGALSYTWSGTGIIEYISEDSVLVNSAGIYLVSSYEEYDNGCSSTGVAALNIQQIPQPIIVSNPGHGTICPGDSLEFIAGPGQNYQWLGPLGEDLGHEQSIFVTQPGTYFCTVTNDGCTLESNLIDAQVYSTPYLLVLPGTDLCATGVATIIAQTNPAATIEWQPPLSGSAPSMNVFTAGTYAVDITFCDITAELSVDITQTDPVATITASDDILCPGGPGIVLSANPGMSGYTWMPGGQHEESITITQEGTYTVEIENESGCTAESVDFNISFYNIATPVASDASICEGSTASLFAAGSGIYWATDPFGLDIVHEGSSFNVPTVDSPFTLFVFAHDANCWSEADVVNVSIYPSSQLYIEEFDLTHCAGEDFTLATQEITTTGMQYDWTLPAGNIVHTPTVVVTSATPAANGWYYFQAHDLHCESEPDSVFVIVENPFNDALIGDDTTKVCVASELIVQSALESTSYQWNTPLGFFNEATIIIDEAGFEAEGGYELLVPGIYCATNSDIVQVDIVAYPDINLNDSMVFCAGGYMSAHLPGGYDQYQWSTGDTDNIAVMPTDGFISVEVTNFPNCKDRDSIHVSNIDCITQFPNIFTPNGDGDNDMVDFGWLRIPMDEVLIYNRWGNLIKRLGGAPWIWNGTTEDNVRVSEGVYYYVVVSGNPRNHYDNLSGYIHVIFNDEQKLD